MLEIIVLTLIVIVAFIATSWYAHQRSQERAKAFERELEIDESREDDSFQQRFDALFEQELHDEDESYSEQEKTRLTDTPDREPDLFDEPPPEVDESGSATQNE